MPHEGGRGSRLCPPSPICACHMYLLKEWISSIRTGSRKMDLSQQTGAKCNTSSAEPDRSGETDRDGDRRGANRPPNCRWAMGHFVRTPYNYSMAFYNFRETPEL